MNVKTYVERKLRRKSVFDQYNYNPYHIPPIFQLKSDFVKTQQEKFDDPNYKWERLPSGSKGDKLISELEKEEKKKFISPLKFAKLGVGDKIEVEYYKSISKGKLLKYKGVVLGFSRPNSLTHSFRFITKVLDSIVILDYLYHSPMLHSIKVIEKGTIRKRNIYHSQNVANMTGRIEDLLKGGKKVNLNKKARQEIRKMNNTKEDIIIE